ncbi:efflux RND transporter permease subunit [Psychromonas aquimarina]|uniref:efflux RND transporter permease subunit n=1 Tax=Psychromonas aquimarina TaxID=444919 RepID=UPI00048D63E2|nr:MMPL family transporter [Psychromonas aquimarina]
MLLSPSDSYDRLLLSRPWLSLLIIGLIVAFFGFHAGKFRLDASADSLVLENDQTLQYYHAIKARYGSDDFLIVTYTPNKKLFDKTVLADLQKLRDGLGALPGVDSVISILDVPLIDSPPVTLDELRDSIRTLEKPDTDKNLARRELLSSPLYSNLLISPDGGTTALQINMHYDQTYYELRDRRNRLREMHIYGELSAEQYDELALVSRQFSDYNSASLEQQSSLIAAVRHTMAEHRKGAKLHLGGVPMITVDSIDFIRHDLFTFGLGVFVFLILLLAVTFGKLRWVLLPLLTCFSSGVVMIGFLGLNNWPVTVVSANFISLLLIITLSLTIHLIVRYQELHAQRPEASQHSLVLETVKKKVLPCFYTSATTMVAFASLLVSDIRPVIDFGWMMTIGMAAAFVTAFTLFPASLVLLKPGRPSRQKNITGALTAFLAGRIESHGKMVLTAFAVLFLLSGIGISLLTVENRFIDYYKKSTEIYQGMELIDRKLGGTTPLDIVIDAPASLPEQNELQLGVEDAALLEEVDFDIEDLQADLQEETSITARSYWFNTAKLKEIAAIHNYLDELPESGKVISLATSMEILETLDSTSAADNFFLSVLYKSLPDELKQIMITPYFSEDGDQIRFSMRVFESDASLQRNELLKKIRRHLTGQLGLSNEQVHLTGMVVLFNNMLQSLFRSQILTIGVVFLAIFSMFILLFRDLKIAAITLVPNLAAAAMVLGLMGWFGIPLDLMTITIAAICIGIAVDDAIHYVHRFIDEYRSHGDYWTAVRNCHGSIGRAIYYTSITVILGFSILALSNFIPTIYFGLLTGFSMLVALLANLTLLPLLLVRFKPLGQG